MGDIIQFKILQSTMLNESEINDFLEYFVYSDEVKRRKVIAREIASGKLKIEP